MTPTTRQLDNFSSSIVVFNLVNAAKKPLLRALYILITEAYYHSKAIVLAVDNPFTKTVNDHILEIRKSSDIVEYLKHQTNINFLNLVDISP